MKDVFVVAAVIRQKHDDQRKILIVRRGPKQSNAGFWEFPGGKVEPQETPQQALVREIQEELSLSIEVGECLGQERWSAGDKTIVLEVYESLVQDTSTLHFAEHDAFRWLRADEIDPQLLSIPDRPFLKKLKS